MHGLRRTSLSPVRGWEKKEKKERLLNRSDGEIRTESPIADYFDGIFLPTRISSQETLRTCEGEAEHPYKVPSSNSRTACYSR